MGSLSGRLKEVGSDWIMMRRFSSPRRLLSLGVFFHPKAVMEERKCVQAFCTSALVQGFPPLAARWH